MAIQWTTTSQASASQGVKMLVYAGAGAGKTVLCATLPRPMVISAEAGLLSLRKPNIERVYGVGKAHISYDIPVAQVTTLAQLYEIYQWLAVHGRQHFGSIGLDSITEIAETVLANAKLSAKDPRQAYGELIDRMLVLIRMFRDLPGYNVYMSSKMEYSKDEASGANMYQPMMPGTKLGQQIPYFFDEVFHLGVGKTQQGVSYRYLRTRADIQYVAKDRSGTLDELEMPDLTNAINKILGA